jgi:O-antigen/teichoic acid export membrane protein
LDNYGVKKNINSFNSDIIKRVLTFAYPLCLTKIFILLSYKVGTVILGSISINYSVYYHLSTSLVIFIIGFIGGPIEINVQTYLSEFYVNENFTQIKNTYYLIINIISFFLIPILIILYGFAPLVINILYSNYYNTEFITLFKITLLGSVFYSLNVLFNRIIIARGKSNLILIAQFFGGVVSILFIAISLLTKIIIYSGIGFIFSTLVIFIIYSFYTKRYTNLTIKQMKCFQIILSSYISILIYEIVYYSLKNIYISTFSSVLVFLLLLLVLKSVSLKILKNILIIIVSPLKISEYKKKSNNS